MQVFQALAPPAGFAVLFYMSSTLSDPYTRILEWLATSTSLSWSNRTSSGNGYYQVHIYQNCLSTCFIVGREVHSIYLFWFVLTGHLGQIIAPTMLFLFQLQSVKPICSTCYAHIQMWIFAWRFFDVWNFVQNDAFFVHVVCFFGKKSFKVSIHGSVKSPYSQLKYHMTFICFIIWFVSVFALSDTFTSFFFFFLKTLIFLSLSKNHFLNTFLTRDLSQNECPNKTLTLHQLLEKKAKNPSKTQ